MFSNFEILDVALLRLRFQNHSGLGLNQKLPFVDGQLVIRNMEQENMHSELKKIYLKLKKSGLTPEQEKKVLQELDDDRTHDMPILGGGMAVVTTDEGEIRLLNIYDYHDLMTLQAMAQPKGSYVSHIRSIDELLEKDRQREKDGFPRKIRVGKMIKPGKAGKGKVVVVPTTVEEKFIHDPNFAEQEEGAGSGRQRRW